jgi:hypothetical protein
LKDRTNRRHPLPESGEARHNEIPETAEREKGIGEEGEEIVQPTSRLPGSSDDRTIGGAPVAVDPEGKPYRYDDLGR